MPYKGLKTTINLYHSFHEPRCSAKGSVNFMAFSFYIFTYFFFVINHYKMISDLQSILLPKLLAIAKGVSLLFDDLSVVASAKKLIHLLPFHFWSSSF